MPIQELRQKKPPGFVVLVAFYMMCAVLSTAVIPVFLAISDSTTTPFLAYVVLATFGLVISVNLILACGLYMGRRWAWILALIFSASGFLIAISALGVVISIALPNSTLIKFAPRDGNELWYFVLVARFRSEAVLWNSQSDH